MRPRTGPGLGVPPLQALASGHGAFSFTNSQIRPGISGLPFSSLYQASQARGFEGGEDWGVPTA